MSELKAEDKKLHTAIRKAMEDDNFYDTILEAAQAKMLKQLKAENKRQAEEMERLRGALKEILMTVPICCDGDNNGDYACDLHLEIAEQALKGNDGKD